MPTFGNMRFNGHFWQWWAQPRLQPALVIVLGGWINLVISVLVLFNIQMTWTQLALMLAATSLFMILFFIFKIAWIHFFAELSGYQGSAKTLFCLLGRSAWPLHLFLPLALIAKSSTTILFIPVAFLLIYAGTTLSLKAVQQNYRASSRASGFISLSPVLFPVGLIFFLILTVLAVKSS